MSIKELPEKIKGSWKVIGEYEKDIFLGLLVVTVACGGFALGRLSKIEETRQAVRIEQVNLSDGSGKISTPVAKLSIVTDRGGEQSVTQVSATDNLAAVGATAQTGKVVASKNGTKYYLPNCSGVKRIKEENKVWFASIEEAKQAGLTAAANCPGL